MSSIRGAVIEDIFSAGSGRPRGPLRRLLAAGGDLSGVWGAVPVSFGGFLRGPPGAYKGK